MKRDLVIIPEVDEQWTGPDDSIRIKKMIESAVPGNTFVKMIARCQCSKPYGTHALGCPIRDL